MSRTISSTHHLVAAANTVFATCLAISSPPSGRPVIGIPRSYSQWRAFQTVAAPEVPFDPLVHPCSSFFWTGGQTFWFQVLAKRGVMFFSDPAGGPEGFGLQGCHFAEVRARAPSRSSMPLGRVSERASGPKGNLFLVVPECHPVP